MSFSRSPGIALFLGLTMGFACPGILAGQAKSGSAGQTSSGPVSSGQVLSQPNQSGKQPNQASKSTPAILPQAFAGWERQGSVTASASPAAADPTNAGILKEYRFTDFESSTYTRDDGRTLKIRAARFEDATGAFGAYTFYLQPEMRKEAIGDQAASLGQRVLFYRGHVLVDALFSQESAMSGGELRELAGTLPRPGGNTGNLPTFIEFMPRHGYISNTQKYAGGAAALAALAPPVSADLVDFGVSSEVSLGRYETPSGEVTLMLISYPTPQMAAEHLRRIDAAHQLARPESGASAIACVGTFCDKRTGPIVAIASGPISESDAKSLLGMVNYEASVTWNQARDPERMHEWYMLILNIIVLCAILGGLAIIAGVAFGGFRVLIKRWFPDKVFDRPEEVEFISLRLTETVVRSIGPDPSQNGSENGRRTPPNVA
jgi:hypothetical protein